MRRPGGAPIAPGGWIGGTTVEFLATVSDPERDVTRLDIEVILSNHTYQDQPTVYGAGVASGATAMATFDQLTTGTWKWHARATDANGNCSEWVDFGTFAADLTPPSTCVGISPNNE